MMALFIEIRDGIAVFQIGDRATLTFVPSAQQVIQLKKLGKNSLVTLLGSDFEFVWDDKGEQQVLTVDLEEQEFENFLVRSGRIRINGKV
jgi:hypothetical protein